MIRIKRHEILLTAVWMIAVNLHRFFDLSGIRADIYLFYDYPYGRYLSNIFYEIGMHMSRIIPAFLLLKRVNHIFFEVIFIYLCLDFGVYLLFFGQGTNIYVITLSLIYFLWKKGKKIFF